MILLLCSVLEQLGGKQIVMQHLGHEDPNVRYEALLAVQKLMVHNWLVCVLRLSCLIPPITHSGAARYAHLRTPTKTTSLKLVQVIPPLNQNVLLLYQSEFIEIKLYFLSLNSKREYLGKQLEKENENQKQGAAPIAGKA